MARHLLTRPSRSGSLGPAPTLPAPHTPGRARPPLTELCMAHTVSCMTYTVKAAGLRKAFRGKTVLDGVDLAVPAGRIAALLGPNGAGKTTLIRILATLLRPDAGSAVVAGHDLLADPVGVRRSISLTGQYAAVDDMLTGEENLRMMARLRHLSRRAARDRAAELLDAFDLADARRRLVKTYSGGMCRRLDLAASLIARPELLVLDEPTTGLDPRSREQLWSAVRSLAADGVTVLLTTQYLAEAEQLADQVAVLHQGRIVAEGTASQLKSGLGADSLDEVFLALTAPAGTVPAEIGPAEIGPAEMGATAPVPTAPRR
jgi:ABC-2 type transport system ATP-binding protein